MRLSSLLTYPGWVAALAGALLPRLGHAQAARRPMPYGSYSTNSAYAQQFSELVLANEPLSWFAVGGELSLRGPHQAPPGSYLTPQYVFSAELRQQFILARIGGRLQFSVDPTFNVRMRRDLDSWPVKTPSYHIGPWASFSLWQKQAITRLDSVPYSGRGGIHYGSKQVQDLTFGYVQAGFFHYSNGQDRPPLLGQATNELGGNFSVNSFHLAGVIGQRDDAHFCSATLLLVHCPDQWADEALPGRYGLTRASLKLTGQKFRSYRYIEEELGKRKKRRNDDAGLTSGVAPTPLADSIFVEKATRNKQRWQVDFTASYGVSSLRLLEESRRGVGKRLNAEVMVTYTPVWLVQAGFFLTAGYYGEDPYNILYLHQYPFARFGIAVGQLRNLWQLAPAP